MSLARIGTRRRITIPKDVFQKLNLEVGAYVKVQATGTSISITPAKRIPKGQAWFYTAEWQAMEREADEAIARGAVSRPFGSAWNSSVIWRKRHAGSERFDLAVTPKDRVRQES